MTRSVRPLFATPIADPHSTTGDGGHLIDPRGNLRAWEIYN